MLLSSLSHPYTILLGRLLLGSTFLFSGLGKVFDLQGTIQLTISYNVLPKPLARIYGIILPWVESLIALMLLAGLRTRYAASGLDLLLLSFAIAVGINLSRKRQIDCGCFGKFTREKMSWATLGRIVFLFTISTGVLVWDIGYLSLDAVLSPQKMDAIYWPSILDFLPVIVTATIGYLIFSLIYNTIRVIGDHKQLEVEMQGRRFRVKFDREKNLWKDYG